MMSPPLNRPLLRSAALGLLASFSGCSSDGSGGSPTGPGGSTGSVTVQATTTGEFGAIDPDGYTVTIGTTTRNVDPNGSVTISGLALGAATATLGGVASNCTPQSTTAAITVSTGAAANAAFTVDCVTLAGMARWATDVGGELNGTAVGTDGRIYAPSADNEGRLFALDADGTVAWSFTAGDAISGPPAVGGDGTIFFGDLLGNAFALNPDGTEKWSTAIGGVFGVGGTPAIAANGTQYWSSDDFLDPPTLTALTSSGGVAWTYSSGGGGRFSGPAVAPDGTVYIGRYNQTDGTFIALNSNGSVKWTYQTAGFPAPAAVGANGRVYFGGQTSTDGASLQVDGDVYALDANGSEAWTFPTGGVIDHAPAIGADGTIYVVAGSDDPDSDPDVGTLYAINSDGTEAWSATLDGCPGGGPTVGADGAVYVPISGCRFGGSGVLEAFDSGGTPLWTFEVTGEFKVLLGSVPIAADGTAYVASQLTGEVYAVKTASLGLAASAWPKAGHDNQNSGGAAGGN